MDARVVIFLWALAIMLLTAPIAWVWGYRPENMGQTLAVLQTVASVLALAIAIMVAVTQHHLAKFRDESQRRRTAEAGRDAVARVRKSLALLSDPSSTNAAMAAAIRLDHTINDDLAYAMVVSQSRIVLRSALEYFSALLLSARDAELAMWLAEAKCNCHLALDDGILGSRKALLLGNRVPTEGHARTVLKAFDDLNRNWPG